MEVPTTPPPRRPTALRTYGKKREAPLFPILSPPPLTRSESIRSSDGSSALPSSDNGLGPFEDLFQIRSSSPVDDDAVKMRESKVEGGLRWVKKEPAESPRSPFNPRPIAVQMTVSKSIEVGNKPSVVKGSAAVPPSSQSTLRAFFAPKPRPEPLLSTGLSLRAEARASSSSTYTSVRPPMSSSRTPLTSSTRPADPIKKFRQLHFKRSSTSSSASDFTTCKRCNMSYIRGEPDSEDEVLHRKNCERVVSGTIWEERAPGRRSTGKQVGGEILFERREREQREVGGVKRYRGVGRILQIDGSAATSTSRISDILSSVDTVLSAPSLPTEMLNQCQIFLFLTSSPTPPSSGKRLPPGSISTRKGKDKERVVGCVVTQPIKWGMRIVENVPAEAQQEERDDVIGGKRKRDDLVVVGNQADEGSDDGGVLCYPERHPVKLGVHRIFTVPAFRGCGIIRSLLDQACRSAIYGYQCDPAKGDVAFSQPTQSGKRVMDTWGQGRVLVFNEDEQDDDSADEGEVE